MTAIDRHCRDHARHRKRWRVQARSLRNCFIDVTAHLAYGIEGVRG